MKRFRVVLVAAATVLFVLAAFTAGAAYDAFRTAITFKQNVQLSDGNVLKAGHYDVQVILNGDGKTADFVFLQGNVAKGRHRGEARGFAGPGGGPHSPAATQFKYDDAYIKMNSPAGTTAQDKTTPLDTQNKQGALNIKGESSSDLTSAKIGNEMKEQKADTGAPGSARAFSWGAAGFGPNTPLKQTEGGGTLTLKLDSSNSSAGIIAILKLVPAGSKIQLKQ